MKRKVTRSCGFWAIMLVGAGGFGCQNISSEQPDPISQKAHEIEQIYKKIETGASPEEMEQLKIRDTERYKNFASRYRSARNVTGYDVGVIPETASCPLSSELVHIFLDNEDDSPNTRKQGWSSSWTIDSQKDSHLYLCKVDARLFSNVNDVFALMPLGPPGPVGNTDFPTNVDALERITMDNEDGGFTKIVSDPNECWWGANMDGDNITLYFYNFKTKGTGGFPNLGFPYGVFGFVNQALATGDYYTDDEDHNNNTYRGYEWGGAWPLQPPVAVEVINTDGSLFRLSKVK